MLFSLTVFLIFCKPTDKLNKTSLNLVQDGSMTIQRRENRVVELLDIGFITLHDIEMNQGAKTSLN